MTWSGTIATEPGRLVFAGLNGLMKHPLHQALEMSGGLLPLLLLDIPLPVASVLAVAVAVQLLLQHANVDYRVGPLRSVLALNQSHRFHHLKWGGVGDVNFGLFTLVWDHLLGTYSFDASRHFDSDVLGIAAKPDYPVGYLAQLGEPFRAPVAATSTARTSGQKLRPDMVSRVQQHEGWHLAQVNVSQLQAPLDSDQLRDFVDLLEPINAVADAAPGFVWRLQTEDGDATAVRVFDDDQLIINMSVWRSLDTLAAFVFGAAHAPVMRRRREWFDRLREAYTALWWVPAGSIPAVAEAEIRLATLRERGPTPYAFTFRHPFAPQPADPAPHTSVDWLCGV